MKAFFAETVHARICKLSDKNVADTCTRTTCGKKTKQFCSKQRKEASSVQFGYTLLFGHFSLQMNETAQQKKLKLEKIFDDFFTFANTGIAE